MTTRRALAELSAWRNGRHKGLKIRLLAIKSRRVAFRGSLLDRVKAFRPESLEFTDLAKFAQQVAQQKQAPGQRRLLVALVMLEKLPCFSRLREIASLIRAPNPTIVTFNAAPSREMTFPSGSLVSVLSRTVAIPNLVICFREKLKMNIAFR